MATVPKVSLPMRLWHSPTFTTWGSLSTRLLSTLVVLPVLLVKFSAAEVVVWQLFATLTTLLLLLDFGLVPTFIRMFSYANGGLSLEDFADMRNVRRRGDQGANPEVVQKVYATLRWLYARMAWILAAVMLFGGTWALAHPMQALEHRSDAWLAWAVWMLSSVAAVWGNAFGAALQGMNKISILRRWEILTTLCQIASSFTVLLLDGGLLALAVSAATWNMLNVYITRRVLLAEVPQLRHVPSKPEPVIVKALLPAAWRSGVGQMMSLGIIQASGVIYSHLAPAQEAAAYLLALRVVTILMGFSTTPFYSKIPRLGELYSRADWPALLALAQRGMALAHVVYVSGAIAVLMLLQVWLEAIGSSVTFVSAEVWMLMSVAYLVERLGAMHMQLYSLTNHIVWHIANGLTGSAMLLIGYLLYPRFGLAAFPLSMLLAYGLIYTPYAVFLSTRHFKLGLFRFELKSVCGPALLLGAALLTYLRTEPWHAAIKSGVRGLL